MSLGFKRLNRSALFWDIALRNIPEERKFLITQGVVTSVCALRHGVLHLLSSESVAALLTYRTPF